MSELREQIEEIIRDAIASWGPTENAHIYAARILALLTEEREEVERAADVIDAHMRRDR